MENGPVFTNFDNFIWSGQIIPGQVRLGLVRLSQVTSRLVGFRHPGPCMIILKRDYSKENLYYAN